MADPQTPVPQDDKGSLEAIGRQLDGFYKRLPKGAGAALTGVGALFTLIAIIPDRLNAMQEAVVTWGFVVAILACVFLLVRSIFRGV